MHGKIDYVNYNSIPKTVKKVEKGAEPEGEEPKVKEQGP
jgi:hypothetical protein